MSTPDRAALCYGDSKGDQVVNLDDVKFHKNLNSRNLFIRTSYFDSAQHDVPKVSISPLTCLC